MDPMRVEIYSGDGNKLQSLEILGATYRGFEVKDKPFMRYGEVIYPHNWIRFRKGYGNFTFRGKEYEMEVL